MEREGLRRAAWAALLSALLPGLGQLYNRQWGKGMGFLLGLILLGGTLLGSLDLEELRTASASAAPPEDLGRLVLLSVLILALALWSIADAARTARTPGR